MERLTEKNTSYYGVTRYVLKEPSKSSSCEDCSYKNNCEECSLQRALNKLGAIEDLLEDNSHWMPIPEPPK